METTISAKYQIILPKAYRRKRNLLPGQKVRIFETKDGALDIELSPATQSTVPEWKKYIGTIIGKPWGDDPVATIRKMRDTEWK
jgi:AbrB family looped-hinge helix DNA binding protein